MRRGMTVYPNEHVSEIADLKEALESSVEDAEGRKAEIRELKKDQERLTAIYERCIERINTLRLDYARSVKNLSELQHEYNCLGDSYDSQISALLEVIRERDVARRLASGRTIALNTALHRLTALTLAGSLLSDIRTAEEAAGCAQDIVDATYRELARSK